MKTLFRPCVVFVAGLLLCQVGCEQSENEKKAEAIAAFDSFMNCLKFGDVIDFEKDDGTGIDYQITRGRIKGVVYQKIHSIELRKLYREESNDFERFDELKRQVYDDHKGIMISDYKIEETSLPYNNDDALVRAFITYSTKELDAKYPKRVTFEVRRGKEKGNWGIVIKNTSF